MIEIANELKAIHRAVSIGSKADGDVVSVLLRRTYDAAIEDVWDAITDPDRLKRWLYPVSGDLRVGGSFQLEGNAGGEILACEPPRRLSVSFGGPTSLVELRLSAEGDATTVELEHTVPLDMAGSTAGALYVGPGWDGALLGLGMFLRGEAIDDPMATAKSREVQEFSRGSVYAWETTVRSTETANADEITAAVAMSLTQFAPDLAS